MARDTSSTRTDSLTRDDNHPQTYNVTVYGDSFSDGGGGTGWIGETLGIQTSENFRYREQATGGDTVAEIRTAFEADFPHSGGNFVVIQGYINSIRTDVSLLLMQTDISAMADAVIANSNYGMAITLQTPWFGHTDWTQARQDITEDLNIWIKSAYKDYYVDVYSALSDPKNPIQLAEEFYKTVRTDVHPSRNGDVVIDDNIGELMFYRNPTITRDADAGNTHPYPNTPTFWGNNLRATIGGNLILMCDGTYSSVNGIIPSSDAISHVARHSWASGITDSENVVAKALVKPGNHQWIKFEFRDKAAAVTIKYFDLLNLAIGAGGSGAFTPTITKAARGWVEVSLTGDIGIGSNNNWININPAEGDADENFVGDVRTPSTYVDRVQLIVL